MSGLRLVKVMPFFAPATRFGGVVTQAAKVCQRLAARGHRVDVVTTDNGVDGAVPSDRWMERDGYRVYYARTRALHRRVPYWSPAMRPALQEALAGADVCALNVGLTLANRLAAQLAARHRVPYVYNAEGALCPVRLRMKGLRKRLFIRLIERRILHGAAACHAVTRKEAGDLLALCGEAIRARTRVIPNGVERFEPGDGDAFRRRCGVEPAQRLVLFLGRLHQVKGLDLLVEAFASLPADTSARLVIAGHDEDGTGGRVRARFGERFGGFGPGRPVQFTGHLEASERRDALTAADLFALTSRSEGLPNAVLEALAAGVPCLLTDPCNVPEVADHHAGRVVPIAPGPIGAALRELLGDPELLHRAGANAGELAAQRFALDSVVDQLESLYGSIR